MKDLYQEVTNSIIEQLEAGIIPWKKTWTGNAAGAISHNTGRTVSLKDFFFEAVQYCADLI